MSKRTVHQSDLRRTLIDHVKRIRVLESRTATLSSNPAGSLAVTDGTTTVDPATEILVGTGLELTDAGGGVASIAEREVPFIITTPVGLEVPGDDSPYPVDFPYYNGGTARSNDIDGEAGYRTNQGDDFADDGTWVGDNFTGDVTTPGSAFAVLPPRGGVYTFDIFLFFRVLAAGGTLVVTFDIPTNAFGGSSGLAVSRVFSAGEIVQVTWNTMRLLEASGGSPDTDVKVTMRQDSGSTSQAGNTSVGVSCFRMSP